MTRRKGELTPRSIDLGWPHQVALLEENCTGMPHYENVRRFAEALSVCSRHHRYRHADAWHLVFCFREKADAERFKERFGGEWSDPEKRRRLRREPDLDGSNKRKAVSQHSSFTFKK